MNDERTKIVSGELKRLIVLTGRNGVGKTKCMCRFREHHGARTGLVNEWRHDLCGHDVVLLNQPEWGMHPQQQRVAAWWIVQAAARNGAPGTIVVETHSPVMLRVFQTGVARGDLASADVALHHLTRDSDGVAHVDTADLHDDGTFGDWSCDFADIASEVDSDFIHAVFGDIEDEDEL